MTKDNRNKKIAQLRKMVAKATRKPAKKTVNHKSTRSRGMGRSKPGILLAPCSARYMFAVADPSDPRGFGACVPKFPSRPSQKIHTCGRFTAAIGVNGYGVVYMTPCLANDSPSILFTDAAYVGTNSTVPAYTSAAVGWNNLNIPLPYPSANFGSSTTSMPAVQGRIISAGVKVTYTGKVVDMAGTYACFSSPDHANCNGQARDIAISFNDAVVKRIGSTPCAIVVSAVSEEETEYTKNNNPGSVLDAIYPYMGGSTGLTVDTSSATIGPAVGVVYLQGTPGTTFYCEYFVSAEYIGRLASQLATVNEVDVAGFNAVAGASQNLSTLKASNPAMSNLEAIQIGVKASLETATKVLDAVPRDVKVAAVRGAGRAMKHWMDGGLNRGAPGSLRLRGG